MSLGVPIGFAGVGDPMAAKLFYGDVLGLTFADEVERLAGAGVVFQFYDGMGQAASGVWTEPEGDQIAWFHDPDGNVLSLTQWAG